MTPPKRPPKPLARPDRVSLWGYLRLFRRDILSAQPARLYHAWMAEFRTPFFRSYLCNDPALVRRVLDERPADFPKSARVTEGLAPLLGRSVFVTNGAEWLRQRRIIDPAFEGGRMRVARLEREGWGQQAIVSAGRLADAEALFFDVDSTDMKPQDQDIGRFNWAVNTKQVQARRDQSPALGLIDPFGDR